METETEMLNKILNEQAQGLKKVYIKDGNIVLDLIPNGYPVSLERCDSYEKIVSWIMHLSEKTWITKDAIKLFCAHAIMANKLDYPQA